MRFDLRRLVSPHCDEAFLSVRPDEAAERAFDGVPRIEDRFLGLGAMGGILSAMQEHPGAVWLMVACGLPFIDDACIRLLVHRSPFRFATAYQSPTTVFPSRSAPSGSPSPGSACSRHSAWATGARGKC